MERRLLADLSALESEAQAFAAELRASADGATLITLSGELGAGKTAFTQALARALGVTDDVTSPTFVLEKVYAVPEASHGFVRLVHIDAYRLNSAPELAPLGFAEVMREPSNLVVLEWPERVADGLPPATHTITLTVCADTARELIYS